MSSITLKTNYWQIKMPDKIYKYSISLEPNPSNRMGIINKIIRDNREAIREKFGQTYLILNFAIFAKDSVDEITFKNEIDGIEYETKIQQTGLLDSECTATKANFIGRFFKILQSKLKLKQIGRKFFNPEKLTEKKGLSIWPGFSTC